MMRRFFLLLLLTFSLRADPITAEKKIFYINIASSAAILAYGYFQWDYRLGDAHLADESWFGKDTKHGGADKLGHFYTTYLLTHVFASIYKDWGVDADEGVHEAFFSSLLFNTIMEIGDGFSDFGFAYEDMLFNLLGAYTGYYLLKNPDVARYIDIRWEYLPSDRITKEGSYDILTDYDGMKFMAVLKGDGFEALQGSFLKYLEFQAGYYTREEANEMHRYAHVGIGINISHLLAPYSKRSSRFFNFYQFPYGYVP